MPGASSERALRWTGSPLCPGVGTGPLLRLTDPLSFWGGVGEDGRVVDGHHPQHGALLVDTVVLLPSGRGSSSSAAVLAERIRTGTAPAAIVLGEPDGILVAGALAAAELYGIRIPLLALPPSAYSSAFRAASDGRPAHVVVDDRSATLTLEGLS